MRCVRGKKKEITETIHRRVRDRVNRHRAEQTRQHLAPPPLRRASRRTSPQGWEVLFKFLFDNLWGRHRGFLDHIFHSSRLGTVYLYGWGELNGSGNGCDTCVGWGRSPQDWRGVNRLTLNFCLRDSSDGVFCLDFCYNDRILEMLLRKGGT